MTSDRPDLCVDYDADADVLYITAGTNGPAVAQEDEPGMVWRYRTDNGHLVGLTLVDFAGYWANHRVRVIQQMVSRFHITEGKATTLLESVH